jgi:hypothetical protein
MFHGLWDGCKIDILFDGTIQDVIIHDRSNATYISVKDTFNGVLRNEKYVINKDLCVRKLDGKFQLA